MRRQGLVFGVTAYLLWGTFPLYFPLLEPAGTLEILACRVLFTAVTVAVLLAVTGRIRGTLVLGRTAVRRLSIAAVLIAVNWGTYIYGVNHHHVVETSLGYFINPLVTVALGVLVLGERLRRAQWAALSLGAVAVAVITVGYGRPPLLALVLAVTFGGYGLAKNRVGVPAAAGLLVEAGVLVPAAAVVMLVLSTRHTETFASRTPAHALLLASSGVVTAIPLLFFAGAASRLPLSTLGLLQYLAPVLQLAVGVLVRHEPLNGSRLAGFVLVWIALVVLSVDGLRHRASRPVRPLDEPVPAG